MMRKRLPRRTFRVSAAFLVVIALRQSLATADEPQYVADEFIVVFTPEARGNIAVGVTAAGGLTVNIAGLQNVFNQQGVNRFARQFPAAQAQPAGGIFHDLTGHYKVRIGGGGNLDAAIRAFSADASVDHIEKIGIFPIDACSVGTSTTPNDTNYTSSQWDLHAEHGIDADLAWSIEPGDASVVVAVLDTGVRYYHQDLGGTNPPDPSDNNTNGNVWVNPFEIPGNGIDDEGNGFIDDVIGWDLVTGNPGSEFSQCDASAGEDCDIADKDPRDFNGHGTHVAGTIAAITNNAHGIAGVAGGFGDGTTESAADGVKIMPLRIGWQAVTGGYVRMDWAAEALNYVTEIKLRGVNVTAVNASWKTGTATIFRMFNGV